jgi:transcriptional regulator with XRE-family HTH domain
MESFRVGSFIAQLRKEKSLTQQELADRLGVTNKAVSKWETGEGYPEITILPTLADALGVTADELLRGERAARQGLSDAEPSQSAPQTNGLAAAAPLQFQNKALLSTGLSVLGILCFFAVVWTTAMDWLGFCLLAMFLFSAMVLFASARNNAKASIAAAAEKDGPDGNAAEFSIALNRQWVRFLCLWSFLILLSLPFLLVPGLHAVIAYLDAVPFFLILGGLFIHQASARLCAKLGVDRVLVFKPVLRNDNRRIYAVYNGLSLIFGVILCMVGSLSLFSGVPMPDNAVYKEPHFLLLGIFLFAAASTVFAMSHQGELHLQTFVLIGLRNLLVPCILAGGLASFAQYTSQDQTHWELWKEDWYRLAGAVAIAAVLYTGSTFWAIHKRLIPMGRWPKQFGQPELLRQIKMLDLVSAGYGLALCAAVFLIAMYSLSPKSGYPSFVPIILLLIGLAMFIAVSVFYLICGKNTKETATKAIILVRNLLVIGSIGGGFLPISNYRFDYASVFWVKFESFQIVYTEPIVLSAWVAIAVFILMTGALWVYGRKKKSTSADVLS